MLLKQQPKQKNAIFCLILAVFFLSCTLPAGAEVPFGVKPQQVEVAFTVLPEEPLQVGIGDNNLPGPDDNKPNKRWGIQISEVNYHLTFWNVGAEGGTSGMLFWKKNYADATLTVNWEVKTAGFANGPAEDIKSPFTGETMHNTWHMEPATNMPEFDNRVYRLQFTGGPNGTFTELAPYQGKQAVTGRVINGKKIEITPGNATGELGSLLESDISTSIQPFFGWDAEIDEANSIYAVLLSGSARVQQWTSMEDTNDWHGSRPMDPGDGVTLSLNKKSLIKVDNQIVTGPNTRVVLKYPDGSEFRIKSNTIVQVVNGGLIVRVGDSRFNLQQQGKKFELITPTSVCGVLGTTFVVHVNKDGSSAIQLIEGKLETANREGTSKTLLNTGESITGTNQGLSPKSKFDIAAVEKEWATGWEYEEAATSSATPWALYGAGVLFLLLAGFMIIRFKNKPKAPAA